MIAPGVAALPGVGVVGGADASPTALRAARLRVQRQAADSLQRDRSLLAEADNASKRGAHELFDAARGEGAARRRSSGSKSGATHAASPASPAASAAHGGASPAGTEATSKQLAVVRRGSASSESDGEEDESGGLKVLDVQRIMRKKSRWVIDPGSQFMRYWDWVVVLLLACVAILTPYECAFTVVEVNALFAFNRLMDALFLLDMGINFLMAYRDDVTGLWVRSVKLIALKYLRMWFWIDFVSIFPFDVFALGESEATGAELQVLRMIRLARLLKLARIMRLSRIFKRWENSLSINYSALELSKFVTWMLVVSHWVACLWELAAVVEDAPENWHSNSQIDYVGAPAATRYLAAVYFAVMTLSTIGYGDVVTTTTTERLTALTCMLIGACMWAYIVANVCGIVQRLGDHSMASKLAMDELNYFMLDKRLDRTWRQRLREYFLQRRRLEHTEHYLGLLRRMSPALRGEVCLHIHAGLIEKVKFFRGAPAGFATAVALSLQPAVYAPTEMVPGDALHIVERGIAAKDGRIYTAGNVWGEDMILTSQDLAMTSPARCLTYVDVQSLSKVALESILQSFPDRAKKVRRVALWIALRRRICAYAVQNKVTNAMAARTGASSAGESKAQPPTAGTNLFNAFASRRHMVDEVDDAETEQSRSLAATPRPDASVTRSGSVRGGAFEAMMDESRSKRSIGTPEGPRGAALRSSIAASGSSPLIAQVVGSDSEDEHVRRQKVPPGRLPPQRTPHNAALHAAVWGDASDGDAGSTGAPSVASATGGAGDGGGGGGGAPAAGLAGVEARVAARVAASVDAQLRGAEQRMMAMLERLRDKLERS